MANFTLGRLEEDVYVHDEQKEAFEEEEELLDDEHGRETENIHPLQGQETKTPFWMHSFALEIIVFIGEGVVLGVVLKSQSFFLYKINVNVNIFLVRIEVWLLTKDGS